MDEADLLSLIDEDLQSIQKQQTPEVTPSPQIEPEPSPQPEPEQKKDDANPLGGLLLFLIVAVLGCGGAFYYFKVVKPKQNVKGGTDLDDFDLEE